MISYNIPASSTQIIEQLTYERARYHVSANKMQCGQKMFSQKGATLKVHRSRLPKAVGVEKPLSSYVTPHSLATRMRHSDDDRHLHELRKENSGPVGVFAPAGTPARLVFSHRTQPGHSPRLATTLQCSCCLAKPVSNCARRPLQPVPHAVPCGS